MALSLSPHHQLKQIIHTPSISSKPLPYSSTPRQFTSVVHDGHANGHESQVKLLPLTPSRVEHATRGESVDLNVHTPPNLNRAAHDLPSWTPLKVPENDGAPEPDDDDLLIRKKTVSEMERHGGQPTDDAQATGGDSQVAATAGRTLKLLSNASPSKKSKLKARFDGVLISTKPPSYRRHVSPPKPTSTIPSTKPRPVGGPLSLVDALARTFNANQHTEAPLHPPDSRQLHANARRRPRDDAETGTETETPENAHLQPNTRLARPGPFLSLSKKRHALTRTSRGNSSSNSNSEDVARPETRVGSRLNGIPRGFNYELERPVKRLKVVQYESNAEWVNAALGTVEAPISWGPALDSNPATEVKDEVVSPEQIPQNVHAPSSDAPTTADESDRHPPTSNSPSEFCGSVSTSTSTPVVNVTALPRSDAMHHMKSPAPPRVGVLSPYKSRGAKFRQRLANAFGAGATVRTDRLARPRSMLVYQDHYYPMLDSDVADDRAQSPAPSESTTSSSVVSVPGSATTPEEGGDNNALPSTHIASLSPGDIPAQVQLDDAGSGTIAVAATTTTTTAAAAELTRDEQIHSWIVALQRLVKGKVRVKEEDLETLSVVLAEIESTKDSLDANVLVTKELRQSVQQLSQLLEIPFGDRNKLRLRAKTLTAYWGLGAGDS